MNGKEEIELSNEEGTRTIIRSERMFVENIFYAQFFDIFLYSCWFSLLLLTSFSSLCIQNYSMLWKTPHKSGSALITIKTSKHNLNDGKNERRFTISLPKSSLFIHTAIEGIYHHHWNFSIQFDRISSFLFYNSWWKVNSIVKSGKRKFSAHFSFTNIFLKYLKVL